MRLASFALVFAAAATVLLTVPRATTPVAAAPPDPPRKPNIVLIVADDLGYGELTVQGFAKDIPTPHIDAIATRGVRFTQGYVSAPLCSPTRAGLATGRYQQRFGHEFNPGPQASANAAFGLPRSETMLAERMKSLGYATGMVGKWHLGYTPELTPPRRGFDAFFGFLGGAHAYLPGTKGASILRGSTPVVEKEYLTDAFAREAVAFIDQHKAEPFFLYLPFNAVHNPLQAPEKYLSRFPGINDQKRRTFAAMTAGMDDAVGRVTGKLDELKLTAQTLVVFISDNGGPTQATSSGNGPLRGFKGQMWEGGIRIPFMMQWPGRLPAGKVYDQPVIGLDVHPTIVAAAGAAVSPEWKLDGVNLLPFLTGGADGRPHETLYWRMGEKHAIRDGDWKVTVEPGTPAGLFNLAKDAGEKTDLSSTHPEKLEELVAKYDAWSAQMADAGRAGGAKNRKAAAGGKKGGAAAARLDARFKQFDKNGDGTLTPEELGKPKLFKQMDANRDGAVTLEEAKKYWAARPRQMEREQRQLRRRDHHDAGNRSNARGSIDGQRPLLRERRPEAGRAEHLHRQPDAQALESARQVRPVLARIVELIRIRRARQTAGRRGVCRAQRRAVAHEQRAGAVRQEHPLVRIESQRVCA
jgi:arylsulfatase A-like enzyme